jgi:hypothetical protein
MLDQTKLDQINQVSKMFLSDNPEQLRHYSLDDLINETVLVYLEGYGGNKTDGDTKYAVSHAAERLSRVKCEEMTGHDFTADEGSAPSGRRNTEDDYVSQLEVDDWVETKLDDDQQFIVRHLLQGYSQVDIASKVGVSQQAISLRVAAIQEIVKGGFDVN